MDVTQNARTVLERRYLKKGLDGKPLEEPEDMLRRVAANIAEAEKKYGKTDKATKEVEQEFFEVMDNLYFIPNSPTLMNAGRELQQLSACFVLPIEDTMESIFGTLRDAALIHKSGGGTGFSFSRIRPKDDIVLSTMGVSSGPVSFMKVFNAATEAIKQGGTRRGANMGILRVDHPDILDFITCKADDDQTLANFNISVAMTEKFMDAVKKGEDYELRNPRDGKVTGKLNAKEVFDLIIHMAWKSGDPGIVFLDRINAANPTPHVGEIESTNPCGEQPLLPYESCNLGSINLARMMKDGDVDWDLLKQTTRTAVHFLDNVIDMNRFPLEEIAKNTRANRKVGLGIMGFADLLIMLGIPYDSDEGVEMAEKVMKFIHDVGWEMSQELAEERGAFPNYEGSIYDGKMKVRNATVTTIAPTGTISIISGVSSGIEPLFAISYVRNVMDNDRLVEVNPLFKKIAVERGFYSEELMEKIAERGSVEGMEEVPEDVRKIFRTAHDINPLWHIKMQAAFQKYTDNAVSKTVNFPNSATEDEIREVYELAYELSCKGVTVYRDGSKSMQVLSTGKTEKKSDAPSPETGEEGILKPRPRPKTTIGVTEKMKTGCGNLYVTINQDEDGLCEVFARMGKSGGCAAAQSEAVGRLVSLALRSGIDYEAIVEQLEGIRCPNPAWVEGGMILSCPDAIGKALAKHMDINVKLNGHKSVVDAGIYPECPECGSILVISEGCATCPSCGWSKCE